MARGMPQQPGHNHPDRKISKSWEKNKNRNKRGKTLHMNTRALDNAFSSPYCLHCSQQAMETIDWLNPLILAHHAITPYPCGNQQSNEITPVQQVR